MRLSEFIGGRKTLMIAPAGHGKTHAIAECVKICPEGSRQLVLTHTHAGIASIKAKLKKLNVDESKFDVVTISGFAQRIVASYVGLNALDQKQEEKGYFDCVLFKCICLLAKESVASVIQISYDGIFVDEYQDCNSQQHKLIMKLSDMMPTHLLGDPLQGIYDFAGSCIDFDNDLKDFERFDLLTTPWRWKADGNCRKLGDQILKIRNLLLSGVTELKLKNDAKSHYRVTLIDSKEKNPANYFRNVGNFLRNLTDNSVLVIIPTYTDPKTGAIKGNVDERAMLCRQLAIDHSYSLLEAIDDKSFYMVAKCADELVSKLRKHRENTNYIKLVYDILAKLKFNKTDLNKWISDSGNRLIERRNPYKEDSAKLSTLVKAFMDDACFDILYALIDFFERDIKLRSKRPSLLHAVKKCIRDSRENDLSVYENMCRYKNLLRLKGRKVDGRYVGTTLLTKGLEFSTVVILDAHRIEDRKNFYVAISRASKELHIFTSDRCLSFKK